MSSKSELLQAGTSNVGYARVDYSIDGNIIQVRAKARIVSARATTTTISTVILIGVQPANRKFRITTNMPCHTQVVRYNENEWTPSYGHQ